ncbi:MAG: DNA primase [Rhodothermaceae bacterium]|nr:DNA primase [Rhodothermaceae bacterium]
MYIPEEYIEDIRSRTDIVELVGEYVRLKRRGTNFIGLCPFHTEKTPSFNVNPSLGIFKCFGCGQGGNAFSFMMQIENLSYPESIRLLAERAGVTLPENEEDTQKFSEAESVYHALRFAGRFFYNELTANEQGRPALEYLYGRGFSDKTIKKYGVGYAPDEWDSLLKAAHQKHIAPETLEKAGLVIPRNESEGHYDRYRGRVTFPIFSHIGKVVGFGGRILKPSDNQAKYINSPETQVYHKSKVLYGLYHGKNAIRKKGEVILVEGYTDVLALHQAGIEHAVASSGTALTEDQVSLIKRYAQRVLVLYDADSAGAKAALRGIDLLLSNGVSVYGLGLPDGEDPDSYVREHGGPAFEDYAENNKMDFVSFLHAQAKDRGSLNTPEGEAQLTRKVIETIAKMPDPSMFDPFIRKASHVLDIPDIRLFEILDQVLRGKNARSKGRKKASRAKKSNSGSEQSYQAPPSTAAENFSRERPDTVYYSEADQEFEEANSTDQQMIFEEPLPQEKMLLRIMLDHGIPMVEYIMGNMALDEFTKGPLQNSISHILELYEKEQVTKQPFVDGSFGVRIQQLATEILMLRYEPSENWERRQNISIPRFNQDPHEAAYSAMKQLKRRRIEQALSNLKSRIFRAQRQNEDVKPLLEERMALLQLQKKIEDPDFLAWS